MDLYEIERENWTALDEPAIETLEIEADSMSLPDDDGEFIIFRDEMGKVTDVVRASEVRTISIEGR